MEKSFFDLVKDGFFLPLTGRNKRINYALLQMLSNKVSLDDLVLRKDTIAYWIRQYIEDNNIILVSDDDDTLIKTPQDYALEKIRYFVQYGWLDEDFDGLNVTYQLNDSGIKLLKTMEDITISDDRPIELSGYVYSIYRGLNDTNSDHAVHIIEQIYDAARQLKSVLMGLNVSIKNFLTKLLKNNEATPREILKILLDDYQNKVILKAFKNLREKDNPSRYKSSIFSRIEYWRRESRMNQNINNFIDVKYDGIYTEENAIIAREFFESRLNFIYDLFDNIEDIIKRLAERNTSYITTAKARVSFLLNESSNIEGKIYDSLRSMCNIDDSVYDDITFDIYSTSNVDDKSLFNPRITKRIKLQDQDELIDSVLSEIEYDEIHHNLFKENEYSVFMINKFVLDQLGDKNKINTTEIEALEFKTILKLFLAAIYSQNDTVDYTIEITDEVYEALGYRLNAFIIERKIYGKTH